MNKEELQKLKKNPHYKLNKDQELQTQQFDVELTTTRVKRKRKNKRAKRQAT